MMTTENAKMTKKDWFNELAEVVNNSTYDRKQEALEFINHEIDLLNKKRTSGSKMTATQRLNEELKDVIKVVLSEAEAPMSISDLTKDERLANYGNQKLTALVSQMVKQEGTVVRTEIKKKAYFSLAEN